MTAPSLGISDWFAPLDLQTFRQQVLGKEPLHVAARPEISQRLLEAFAVHTVDDLLALHLPHIHAWFQTLDKRHTSVPIPLSVARAFYDGGTTLYAERAPEFEAHEGQVRAAFGMPPRSSVKCSFFCNRPGAKTRAHFDGVDIITVQLKGRKTWTIAPNSFAPMPLRSVATRGPVPLDVRMYAPDPLPETMPDGSTSYLLEAGSLLHVPRGYWHETISDEDSLSLHVLLTPPNWYDIVFSALRNETARDLEGRKSDYGVGDPGALDRATTAIAALRDALSRLDARDVVRLPVSEEVVQSDTHFVRCGQAAFGIDSVDERTAFVTIASYDFRETKTVRLEMNLEFVSACRWINGLVTGTPFDIPELRRAAPLSPTEAQELLGVLERARLVRRVLPA